MNDEQFAMLAEHLAQRMPVLAADCESNEPMPAPARVGVRDPDVSRAIRLEISRLIKPDPDLQLMLASSARPPSKAEIARITDRLREHLQADDKHAAEILWSLLGGSGAEHEGQLPRGRLGRLHERWIRNGRLARQGAAIWMNVLIAIPVIVAFLTVWGGIHKETKPPQIGIAGLKIFAVWCLAFLPGWLYVRFLGQRAGALWTEFTLVLHRLGWDRPEYLPRPPVDSQFYDDWVAAGGPQHGHRRNIYRQKFDAYYGRSVAEDAEGTNFSVRIDTMFPVFLTTAMLAVAWTATLWSTKFASDPSTVWDSLKFAFLGAYAFVAQSLVRRFFQADLRPSAYASAVLRFVFVLLTATALHQILDGLDPGTECAVMFVVGFFPVVGLQALNRLAASTLRVAIPQLTPDYPLNQLDGLNLWYEARLLEEGIEDMQNLATANLIDVILHTRVPVGRLVDWVDQALLYIHLDRAERGWSERRDVKKAAKKLNKARVEQYTGSSDRLGMDALVDEASGLIRADAAPAGGAADVPATHRRERRSVNPLNRAGTQTRIALRQIGIRTATDLLKAFPPDLVDPARIRVVTARPAPPSLGKWLPEGVDPDQIRMLARVLDEERSLAAVWNWQSRGVETRNEYRRPRSTRLLDVVDLTENAGAVPTPSGNGDAPAH